MFAAFAAAETMDAVDEALLGAEGEANDLLEKMDGKLDLIIEVHGLAGTNGKKSDGEKLAEDLRKAVRKDINNTAGKAVSAADRRKAELQKE